MFAGVMFAGALGLVTADAGLFLPLLAAQLLWINLVTDGPPALALGIDPKDPEVMARRPRRHGAGVLSGADWLRIGLVGAVMMAGTIAVLDAYYPGGMFTLFAAGSGPNAADEARARTMAFTTLMVFQLFNVYVARSARRGAFAGALDNGWLMVAVAASLLAHVLVIYVPLLQEAFRTVPLALSDWLVAAGVGATLPVASELARAVIRRGGRRAPA
jgi:Ca2+-transporting ATPase